MDPLSAVGTIISLLAVACKLKSAIKGFIEATADAPSEVRSIASELHQIDSLLTRLEDLFTQPSDTHKTASVSNTSSLPLEIGSNLACVLEECRKIVVQLADIVETSKLYNGASNNASNSNLRAVRKRYWAKFKYVWANKQKDVDRIRREIAMHKSTLTLTLMIISHTTTSNIQETTARIEEKIKEVREAIDKLEKEEGADSGKKNTGSSIRIKNYLDYAESIFTTSQHCTPAISRASTFPQSPGAGDGGSRDSGISDIELEAIQLALQRAPETWHTPPIAATPSVLRKPPVAAYSPVEEIPPEKNDHIASLKTRHTVPQGRSLTMNNSARKRDLDMVGPDHPKVPSKIPTTSVDTPEDVKTKTSVLPSESPARKTKSRSSSRRSMDSNVSQKKKKKKRSMPKKEISITEKVASEEFISINSTPRRSQEIISDATPVNPRITPTAAPLLVCTREVYTQQLPNNILPLHLPPPAFPLEKSSSPQSKERVVNQNLGISTQQKEIPKAPALQKPSSPQSKDRIVNQKSGSSTQQKSAPKVPASAPKGIRWDIRKILRIWAACLLLWFTRRLNQSTRLNFWKKLLGGIANDLTRLACRKIFRIIVIGGGAPLITVEATSYLQKVPMWYMRLLAEEVAKVVSLKRSISTSVKGKATAAGTVATSKTIGWGMSKFIGFLAAAPLLTGAC